jgi:hypothetical protein
VFRLRLEPSTYWIQVHGFAQCTGRYRKDHSLNYNGLETKCSEIRLSKMDELVGNLGYYICVTSDFVIYMFLTCDLGNRDWIRAGQPRVRSSSTGRVNNFFFSTSSRPALGCIQPPIHLVPRALSPGVKWQGREPDHWPVACAEVNKIWIYTSTPHMPSWRSA